MPQTQKSDRDYLDEYIKKVTYRNIIAIVVCTAVSCSTALSIFYGIKQEIADGRKADELLQQQIRFLEYRIDKLEKNK
jgi:hypothetical protein